MTKQRPMTAEERAEAEQLAIRADRSLEAAAVALEAVEAAKRLRGFEWETGTVLARQGIETPPAILRKRAIRLRKAAAYIRRLARKFGRTERPDPVIPDPDSIVARLRVSGALALRQGGETGTMTAWRMLKKAQEASLQAGRASDAAAMAGALPPSLTQVELARRALTEIRAAHAAIAAGVAALETSAAVRVPAEKPSEPR